MAGPAIGANAAPPINVPQARLPPEICERIIDHIGWILNEDRSALLNCALVCRGWYAKSRAIFFTYPQLRTPKQAVACVTSLKQIPLLATRVQSLQIGSYSDPQTVVTGPELASILLLLAGKLPKLKSLSLPHVSFEHCSMRHLAFWSLHEFSHIVHLYLRNVTLPSASPFVQVICSFPHLQFLSCYNLCWSKPRSMAPLPERHRMPLTTVTSLHYDLSCLEDIRHVLLGLLDQAILQELRLEPAVSEAALSFTQDMLNMAGTRLEHAAIPLKAPEEDTGDNFQSLLSNVNLQGLFLAISSSEVNDIAQFVRSVLPPLISTISSKGLEGIRLDIVCSQIDELLAEGHFTKLQDVSIEFEDALLDGSQHVAFCTEICARFPKLNDKNMLIEYKPNYKDYQCPSEAERALKAKQLAEKPPRPTEQAAT
ncbi:uncharacterized protein LAESUDRAFT_197606 [Laetiporus sulphureus 93-53]|uniref:Uncharacterized protein n=1 Tax=Laetiporus sulphureus 93-53 TaxID=1314785 RepID=A0A165E242_9APHY|nr:uncharacterized protein LAESUDRAFT_197606 [Laetiporus sulphureus 93-53]KZT06098.1 hypothetical protein LAESUDRAFT_197606 [Laetiporus sulphureus 93-53]